MDFSKIIDFIKLKPIHLFPISLSTGLLLFLPEHIIQDLGLYAFTHEYKGWIGLVFLLSNTFLSVHIVNKLFAWIKKQISLYRRKKQFKYLSPEEKVVLGMYIFQDTKTLYFGINNGIVHGLRRKGILFMPSGTGFFDRFAFNIQPWAWEYLRKNKGLLKLSPKEKETLESYSDLQNKGAYPPL